jgi:hypothetical protein
MKLRSRPFSLRVLVVAAAAMTLAPPGLAAAAPSSVPSLISSYQGHNWEGDLGTPSDQTGAIGPDRYFEFTNSGYLISDRSGSTLGSGTAAELAHISDPDVYAFDIQANWDPSTSRFYFAAIQSRQPAPDYPFLDNQLVYGFSKTSAPEDASDFCVYRSTFGTYGNEWFPDFPKLGTSGDFLLLGVNAFTLPDFEHERTDVAWVSKPPPGPTCPAEGSLREGIQQDLRDPTNPDPTTNSLFTPIPAQRYASGDPTGWIVATPGSIYGPQVTDEADKPAPSAPWIGGFRKFYGPKFGSAHSIFVLTVTKAPNGDAVVGPAKAIAVPQYAFPPNAPQLGTDQQLDTHDARFVQAILSYDPVRKRLALWTQHTVFGGAGSEIRWYEVDVNAATILRKGAVSSSKLWYYNGAITSDRVVRGTTEGYGGGWSLGFNSSSASQPLRIQMLSQSAGATTPSPIITVKVTEGPAIDGSCQVYGYCRWGDYAAATPDPAAPLGRAGGNAWFTNGFSEAGASPTTGHGRFWWSTWNWGAAVR